MPQAEENDQHKELRCLVLKFGGTSVEDAPALRRAAGIVAGLGEACVVVVSALAGTTDQLLAAGEEAARGKLVTAEEIVRSIRERHAGIAAELLPAGGGSGFRKSLEAECDELLKLVRGIAALGEFSARTADRMAGAGEILSSCLFAECLQEGGRSAVWVDARKCIVTDDAHGAAQPLREESDRRVVESLLPLLERGQVAVLGGFIAATREGTPTTLGRGGSDFSAALVAGALRARALEIWTDVDGIMTADPRLCPDARLISKISFGEAAELAQAGAKVLHPATLLPAMENNIPVYVRNSRQPENRGTRIVREGAEPAAVRAITLKRGAVLVEARLRGTADAASVAQILAACDQQDFELCSISRHSAVLLLNSKQNLREMADALQHVAEVRGENHKAVIRVFGDEIGRRAGDVAQIFQTLAGIEVRLAYPGEGERNVALVVDEDLAAESVQRLHRAFFPADEKASEFTQRGVQ